MVLELKPPNGTTWQAMQHTVFTLLLYLLSFVFLGIYWTNHHHMFQATRHVTGGVLWANLHLLFWLSLVPFVTSWMGQSHFDSFSTAIYGVVFLAAAVAYTILQSTIIAHEGSSSRLAAAVGRDRKGKLSLASYATAIGLAFVHPLLADGLYVIVALIWLVPDRRIEAILTDKH